MNDNWIPMPRYILRKHMVKQLIKNKKLAGKIGIEIGYGSGEMLLFLHKLGLKVHGYDFSDVAYQHANLRISDSNARGEIKLLTDEADISKENYDYVFAFEVLEHMKNDISELRHFKEYLIPGGRLILSVPGHMSKWGPNDEWAGHYRRYSRKELYKKLTVAGFRVYNIWNYAYPLSILLDPLLHRSHQQNTRNFSSREKRSKYSGIRRKQNWMNLFIGNRQNLLLPFCFLQELFLKTDLGSSYLAVAQRK